MGDSSQVAEETIGIDSGGSDGNTVSVRMMGATIVSVHISGDAVAEYQVDVRKRGGSWIEDVGPEYAGQSDYDDVLETGAQEVRLRCSSGSGGSGDEATITIMAGG